MPKEFKKTERVKLNGEVKDVVVRYRGLLCKEIESLFKINDIDKQVEFCLSKAILEGREAINRDTTKIIFFNNILGHSGLKEGENKPYAEATNWVETKIGSRIAFCMLYLNNMKISDYDELDQYELCKCVEIAKIKAKYLKEHEIIEIFFPKPIEKVPDPFEDDWGDLPETPLNKPTLKH